MKRASLPLHRREFIASLGGAAAWPVVARAQQTAAMSLVGFFSSRSPEDLDYLVTAFRHGLIEQGYVEGQNVMVEYQWARGQWERLPSIATNLVAHNVGVLVAAGGEPAVFAAKAATNTIPIVFGVGGDPVKEGIVSSFNHPGGNATGTMLMTGDLEEKGLSILHQLVPSDGPVAVLLNPTSPLAPTLLSQIEAAAHTINQHIQVFYAGTEQALEATLAEIVGRTKAFFLTADPFFDTQRSRILPAIARARLPAIYQFREYVIAGGLMSYGPNITENYRQFGIYVGRILKGAKPADLPIVRSSKFEFVINQNAAREIGVAISPALLAVADEVIE